MVCVVCVRGVCVGVYVCSVRGVRDVVCGVCVCGVCVYVCEGAGCGWREVCVEVAR